MKITVLRKHVRVKHYLYYGIILLFVFVVQAQQGEKGSQQESPKAESSVSPPSSAAQATAENANIQKPEAPIQESNGAEQTRGASEDRVTRAERIQIGINVVMFLVVLVQTVIYIQQRNIMRQQVELARISERAYIGIKRVITENQVVGAVPNVRVTLLNGGRTPAYSLKAPGHMTFTKAGLPFPHERPETTKKEGSGFLPAGNETTYNYRFVVPWTPEWEHAIETGQYVIFLHMEAQFVDAWGDNQITPFKLAYRATDQRWGEYKDPKDTEPIITIS